MERLSIEEGIIKYAAPTLAGIKCGSLFNYYFYEKNNALSTLKKANNDLNKHGVYVEAMKWKEGSVLIYIYRKKELTEKLKDKEIRKMLFIYEYYEFKTTSCLDHLRKRLYSEGEFPHEVGIFLDYPLEDVKGFIEHKGYHYKRNGLWKVYDDEVNAENMFRKYKLCSKIYMRLFFEGKSLESVVA